MAQVRIRTYTRRGGKSLDSLQAELTNTLPILESIGNELVRELQAEITPHNRTGRLASGLAQVSLYQKRGRAGMMWAIGIGDPNILTDWHTDAPRGTIAEFLRWIWNENKQFRKPRQPKAAKARTARVARFNVKQQLRQAKREQTQRALEKLKTLAEKATRKSTYAEDLFEELYKIRKFLTRRGKSLEFQKNVFLEQVRATLKDKKVFQGLDEFRLRQLIGDLYIKSRHFESVKRIEIEQLLVKRTLEQIIQEIYRKSSIKNAPGRRKK